MNEKVVVIGSGISGLSISRMLAHTHEVKILEKADKKGGLIKCERVNGNLFHRVGGHVFNSKNKEVLEWFWKHFDRDKEFLSAKRNAKILFSNKLVGYPIENFLYELPNEQAERIVLELLEIIKQENKERASFKNFEEFLKGNFGNSLYELYFGPYNTKIWNTDISKVPLEWLDGKLPMPKIDEVIVTNIIKKEENHMVHSTFYYPKRDGSQFIVDRLSESLDITLSYDVASITVTNQQLSINDSLNADVIVYCGDVRKLDSVINIDDLQLKHALMAVKNLPSNGTSNVLCETDENDISWLYLPESKFKAHRIIYTGNFSETNNEGTERKTCVVEFSGKHEPDEMKKELELLPGNLKPLAFNYEPNSYVIQNTETRDQISTLKKLLLKYNIYLLGRFAEWEYHNMDKCVEAALELSKHLMR
jgi:protoporphyrinogen oxidase